MTSRTPSTPSRTTSTRCVVLLPAHPDDESLADSGSLQIVSLRNMVVRLDPKVDVGQASLRADLDSLAALTTKTGKGVVALETWLGSLQKWGKQVRELVKAGQVGETMKEVGEIKYHLAGARLVRPLPLFVAFVLSQGSSLTLALCSQDFEDAMERYV